MKAVSEGTRSIWDEYRLLGELFRGPATVAWKAEHVISGRPARLTTVHAPPMASGVTAEAVAHAFRRAAERAREFVHPDHLSIIGIAEQSGLPVAVTMLPEGMPLAERLADRPVPLGEVMKQVSQIAHAVAALHAASRRHGYLIPENLWVRPDGRVALLDSGIHAAAAHAAFSSGFPMSPCAYVPAGDEAYAEASPGADVYALVALLVRLVVGRTAPPEGLTVAIEGLPDELPASLRAEFMAAVTAPMSETAPAARSLAVHLAFDSTWIRAQERSRRECDVVNGELLVDSSPPRSGASESADVTAAREVGLSGTWSPVPQAAGVRGGAAAPAEPTRSRLFPLGDLMRQAAEKTLPRKRERSERAK